MWKATHYLGEESVSVLTCFFSSLGNLFSQHHCEQTVEPKLCILCSGQRRLSAPALDICITHYLIWSKFTFTYSISIPRLLSRTSQCIMTKNTQINLVLRKSLFHETNLRNVAIQREKNDGGRVCRLQEEHKSRRGGCHPGNPRMSLCFRMGLDICQVCI